MSKLSLDSYLRNLDNRISNLEVNGDSLAGAGLSSAHTHDGVDSSRLIGTCALIDSSASGGGNVILKTSSASNVTVSGSMKASGLALGTATGAGSGQIKLSGVSGSHGIDLTGAMVSRAASLADSASIAVDWNESNVQFVTLGGDRSVSFSNGVDGGIYVLGITQDATGSRLVSDWSSNVRWEGPAAPTLTAFNSKTDWLAFVKATISGSSLYDNILQSLAHGEAQSDTGWLSPATGSQSGTGAQWGLPGNITSDNGQSACAVYFSDGWTSYLLEGKNLSVGLDTSASIQGFEVSVDHKASACTGTVYIKDYSLKLMKSGTATGSNLADTTNKWLTTAACVVYGASNNMWGDTWTPADVNASGFGAQLQVQGWGGGAVNVSACVDHVQVKIYYSI